jgi:hypothetical protein
MKPRFTFLVGDYRWQEHGGTWISQKLNNGDWDYWLVMELWSWRQVVPVEDAPAKYHVSLAVVSPEAAGDEKTRKATEWLDVDWAQITDAMKVEALYAEGIRGDIWDADGNNYRELMRECRREARMAQAVLGFYLDRRVNMIDNDGWDAVRGQIGRKVA